MLIGYEPKVGLMAIDLNRLLHRNLNDYMELHGITSKCPEH